MRKFNCLVLASLGFLACSSPDDSKSLHQDAGIDVIATPSSSTASPGISSSCTGGSSSSSSSSSGGRWSGGFGGLGSGGGDAGLDAPDDGSIVPPSGSFDILEPDPGPIVYWGGQVMTQPINVYFIWYGSWTTPTATILEDMIMNIAASPLFQINTEYYQVDDTGSKTFAAKQVNFAGSSYVGYLYGHTLYNPELFNIMSNAFNNNIVPMDKNAQYFILPSKDVTYYDVFSKGCDNMCGFHRADQFGEVSIKYAVIGDPMACPTNCTALSSYNKYGFTTTPNIDPSADGMSGIMLHELSEMITDPDPYNDVSWRDSSGLETADLCSWVYSDLYLTPNGSIGNVHIGNKDFLIQENWVLSKQTCGLHL